LLSIQLYSHGWKKILSLKKRNEKRKEKYDVKKKEKHSGAFCCCFSSRRWELNGKLRFVSLGIKGKGLKVAWSDIQQGRLNAHKKSFNELLFMIQQCDKPSAFNLFYYYYLFIYLH